jgi:hypothetical protein
MAAAASKDHLVQIATDYTEYIKEKYRKLYKFIGPEKNTTAQTIYI